MTDHTAPPAPEAPAPHTTDTPLPETPLPDTPLTAAQHYRALRADLTALAATLTSTDLATPVPALPGWTVHDTYAHLTGVCADLLTGTAPDPKNPDWTDTQVTARRTTPITDVLDEWTHAAPALETFLDDPAGRPAVFAVFDLYHHTHDIRSALHRPTGRDDAHTRFVAATMAKLHRKPWTASGRPTITLTTGTGTWQLGDGRPAATLTTTDFELARLLIGRRSPAQMRAAGWNGDPDAVETALAALPAFGPPTEDLIE